MMAFALAVLPFAAAPLATAARAQDAAANGAENGAAAGAADEATERPQILDHHGQTGVAVLPGTGYRMIVPYRAQRDCGDSSGIASKRVCTRRVPTFVDLELSQGAWRGFDLLADLRIGVEKDFTDTRQLALAAGVRYWIDPDAAAKAFTAVQLVVDHTGQNAPGIADTDYGVRLALGFMYDLLRNFGVYARAGTTIGVRRWFRMELDLALGAQVRFP